MGMMVLASSAASLRHDSSLSSPVAEQQHGVVPLLAAAPPASLVADSGDGARGKTFGGVHLWNPPPPFPDRNPNILFPHPNHNNPSPNFTRSGYLAKPVPTGVDVCGILANYATEAAAEGGGPSCHHCGNSRSYGCSTHVKNTWVPAARRPEPLLAASSQKKPRLAASLPENASHAAEHNAAPSWSSDTTASVTHRDAVVRSGLPRQVRAPAMFRCVRVTPVDSSEMEYAYHATVRIGGRVFKGILYCNGVDGGKASVRNMSDLHLGNQNGGASSSGLLGGANCGN